jgi:hypothetical protein
LRHEENEYVPLFGMGFAGGKFASASDAAMVGMFQPADMGQPFNNFTDGWGVRWVASDSAIGGQIPQPGNFILKDITRWKKEITIPDVSHYDWPGIVAQEYGAFKIDREKQALCYVSNAGVWERLADLMGFEGAMIALMEEPEACDELFTAITDHKIRLAEVAAKHYQADVFINFDDVAAERNMFMSPDTYRAMIKPHWKRLHNAVKNLGMIPSQHICGYARLCLGDYIDTGANCWNSCQPTNDVAEILAQYGDRFCMEGGWNTNGKASLPGSGVEDVRAEVERCFREYGDKKGYIFLPLILASTDMTNIDAKNGVIVETINKLRFAGK